MECLLKQLGIYFGVGQNHKLISINYYIFKELIILILTKILPERIYFIKTYKE